MAGRTVVCLVTGDNDKYPKPLRGNASHLCVPFRHHRRTSQGLLMAPPRQQIPSSSPDRAHFCTKKQTLSTSEPTQPACKWGLHPGLPGTWPGSFNLSFRNPGSLNPAAPASFLVSPPRSLQRVLPPWTALSPVSSRQASLAQPFTY